MEDFLDNITVSKPPKNGKGPFLAACLVLVVIYIGFSFAFHALADPPTSPYIPGETLNPNCSPTSTNCTVEPPLFSTSTLPQGGVLFMNDASGTVSANTSSLWWNSAVNQLSISNGSLDIGTSTSVTGSLLTVGTSSNIVTILNNGNVGIGTTTPANALTVVQRTTGGAVSGFLIDGTSANANADITLNRGNNTADDAGINFNTGGSNNWQLGLQNNNTNNFQLWDGSNNPALTIVPGTFNADFAGSPGQSSSSSLLQLGPYTLIGGNVSGTWLGVNASSTSSADFLNLQSNSSTLVDIASSGAVTFNESAGTQFQILATAVPTADLFHIANSPSTAVTTSGLNNLQSDYYGGTGAVEAANIKLTVTAGPTSGSIWDGIRIIENTTTQAGVTENAVKIDPITTSTGTANGIFIGSGWKSGLVVAANPIALATTSLIQLASTSIQNGNSASGTFIGINPSSYGGDFLNFEVNSTTQFDVSATGTVLAKGLLSIGSSSAVEGALTFDNSVNNFTVTLQGSTTTGASYILTLPSSTGAAGQSLVTDGKGNLSWGSTGFTISVATTTVASLTTTTSTYVSTGLHPSSASSQVWITGDIVASTTAQSSTITVAAYSGANACTAQVGNPVSVELSLASGTILTTGISQQADIAINVIASPATTSLTSYTLCARASGSNAKALSGTITLQEIRAGSDIAEVYNAATDTPLVAGNLVSLDPSIDAGVMPSQMPYDNTLLGVVSTQPGAVLGNADPTSGGSVLVALAGRVPVDVTSENGNISVGDELTSSDIPGYAMRATAPGRDVGIAMESFSPDPSSGITTGTILMFVNPTWSLGNLTDSADIASSSWALSDSSSSAQYVVDQFTAYVQAALAKLGVAIANGIVTIQELIANKVVTNELCVQGTCVTGDQLSNLLNSTNNQNAAPSSAITSATTTVATTTTTTATDTTTTTVQTVTSSDSSSSTDDTDDSDSSASSSSPGQ